MENLDLRSLIKRMKIQNAEDVKSETQGHHSKVSGGGKSTRDKHGIGHGRIHLKCATTRSAF